MNIDYKNINMNDWELSGEGGTSFTYYHKTDESLMLKILKPNVNPDIAIDEYNVSKKVNNMGLKTPKVFALTEVDNKKCIVYERIKNKISFSRMMANDNTTIDFCAKELATYSRNLHNTTCDTKEFGDIKNLMQSFIDNSPFDIDIKNKLQHLLDNTKDEHTCVHGDFQPSNYLYANGTTYIIDLSTFSYGCHMFDIGSLYFTCNVIITEQEKLDLFHMKLDDLSHFFDVFCKEYLQTDDENTLKDFYKEAHRYSSLIMNGAFQIIGRPKEKRHLFEERIKEALS